MSFSIPQGSHKDLEISGLGDLTGCVGHLAVKNNATGVVVISKSTANVSEGEVVAPVDSSGTLRFHFVPADTSGLPPSPTGSYSFDAWIVTGAGKQHQVRAVSTFAVTARVKVLP